MINGFKRDCEKVAYLAKEVSKAHMNREIAPEELSHTKGVHYRARKRLLQSGLDLFKFFCLFVEKNQNLYQGYYPAGNASPKYTNNVTSFRVNDDKEAFVLGYTQVRILQGEPDEVSYKTIVLPYLWMEDSEAYREKRLSIVSKVVQSSRQERASEIYSRIINLQQKHLEIDSDIKSASRDASRQLDVLREDLKFQLDTPDDLDWDYFLETASTARDLAVTCNLGMKVGGKL